MSYQAGDTYPAAITIRDGAGAVTDPESLTLVVRDNAGEITTLAYGTDAEIVRDSEGVFHADIPLTAPGMWVFEWATTNEAEVQGVQVYVSAAPSASVTFATLDQLALRLGITGAADLTAWQAAQGAMLLELVTALIVEAVDKTDEWAATLDPIPAMLRAVCLEAVARVMQNPGGVSSESETLGAYSHTARYEFSSDQGTGVMLTEAEGRAARRAVYGVSSGSAYPISIVSAP
jgi:hypothetical protein